MSRPREEGGAGVAQEFLSRLSVLEKNAELKVSLRVPADAAAQ